MSTKLMLVLVLSSLMTISVNMFVTCLIKKATYVVLCFPANKP